MREGFAFSANYLGLSKQRIIQIAMTMENLPKCPDCGADWTRGLSCTNFFHQMLFWESEWPELGAVHHLMVLCYHLQHPNLYSQAGLEHAAGLLHDFVIGGLTTEEVRRRQREMLSSTNRTWKVASTTSDRGKYDRPIAWKIIAADVVAGGPDEYVENVRAWAASVLEQIALPGA